MHTFHLLPCSSTVFEYDNMVTIDRFKETLDFHLQYQLLSNIKRHMALLKPTKDYKRYLQAALAKGPAYFQYEQYPIPVDNTNFDQYEIIDKIGRGKYSDVYKGIKTSVDNSSSKVVVLKILKPIRQGKIRREIKILKTLKHPSIIQLDAVLRDECSKTYILAMDYVEVDDSSKGPSYTDQEIRLYIYKILEGLNYCHSMGIMHRDIKPQNVLIDQKKQILKIVDWGLADYYLPNKEYNVRVASRYYKGPELLTNNKFYDYSLDIWSLGCMFAGMIFKRGVMFKGDDNVDQLKKIAQVLGTSDVERYIQRYKLKPETKVRQMLQTKKYPKRKFEEFINEDNKHLACEQALDLLKMMLVVDHMERTTAPDAMLHPYFDNIRKL